MAECTVRGLTQSIPDTEYFRATRRTSSMLDTEVNAQQILFLNECNGKTAKSNEIIEILIFI